MIKTVAIICITACIADFVVLFVLGNYYPGLSQLKNSMSSLGATISPVSNIISNWWIFIRIVFIYFGLTFKKVFGSHLKSVKIASLLIMLYGLGEGIGSGVFKADIIAGKMTHSFTLHNIVGGIGVVAALLLPLFVKQVITNKNNPAFYLFSWIVFIVGFFTMLLFTFHFSSDENNFIKLNKGLWQRLFLLNLYIYFIWISIIMYNKKM